MEEEWSQPRDRTRQRSSIYLSSFIYPQRPLSVSERYVPGFLLFPSFPSSPIKLPFCQTFHNRSYHSLARPSLLPLPSVFVSAAPRIQPARKRSLDERLKGKRDPFAPFWWLKKKSRQEQLAFSQQKLRRNRPVEIGHVQVSRGGRRLPTQRLPRGMPFRLAVV